MAERQQHIHGRASFLRVKGIPGLVQTNKRAHYLLQASAGDVGSAALQTPNVAVTPPPADIIQNRQDVYKLLTSNAHDVRVIGVRKKLNTPLHRPSTESGGEPALSPNRHF